MVIACALMSVMTLHAQSKVYMTKEISPEALVRIYKQLGVPAHGHVADYFGKNIIYINVMNNMSVDCDSHPADPKLKDMGILASTDPVALDQACLDLVFNHKAQPGADEKPLIERINCQHGTYITDTTQVHGINEVVVTGSLSLLDSTPIPWLTSMRRNMWIMWRCSVDGVINNGYQMPGFTAMGGVKVRF